MPPPTIARSQLSGTCGDGGMEDDTGATVVVRTPIEASAHGLSPRRAGTGKKLVVAPQTSANLLIMYIGGIALSGRRRDAGHDRSTALRYGMAASSIQ